MNEPLSQLEQTLRKQHYSLTKARRTVFQALQDHEPQTMRELVAGCADIDRASIYRTILLFERMGIVQRLQVGWKYKLELTGAFMSHHHHASCTRCGRLIPLPEDTVLEKQLHRLAESHGFHLQGHQIELNGICSECQGLQISDKQKGAV